MSTVHMIGATLALFVSFSHAEDGCDTEFEFGTDMPYAATDRCVLAHEPWMDDIVLIVGCGDYYDDEDDESLHSMWTYNITDGEYSLITEDLEGEHGKRSPYQSQAILDDSVYWRTEDYKINRYDFRNFTYDQLIEVVGERTRHAWFDCMTTDNHDSLFLVGGRNETTSLDWFESLSYGDGYYTREEEPLPKPLHGSACGVSWMNEALYVFGGNNATSFETPEPSQGPTGSPIMDTEDPTPAPQVTTDAPTFPTTGQPTFVTTLEPTRYTTHEPTFNDPGTSALAPSSLPAEGPTTMAPAILPPIRRRRRLRGDPNPGDDDRNEANEGEENEEGESANDAEDSEYIHQFDEKNIYKYNNVTGWQTIPAKLTYRQRGGFALRMFYQKQSGRIMFERFYIIGGNQDARFNVDLFDCETETITNLGNILNRQRKVGFGAIMIARHLGGDRPIPFSYRMAVFGEYRSPEEDEVEISNELCYFRPTPDPTPSPEQSHFDYSSTDILDPSDDGNDQINEGKNNKNRNMLMYLVIAAFVLSLIGIGVFFVCVNKRKKKKAKKRRATEDKKDADEKIRRLEMALEAEKKKNDHLMILGDNDENEIAMPDTPENGPGASTGGTTSSTTAGAPPKRVSGIARPMNTNGGPNGGATPGENLRANDGHDEGLGDELAEGDEGAAQEGLGGGNSGIPLLPSNGGTSPKMSGEVGNVAKPGFSSVASVSLEDDHGGGHLPLSSERVAGPAYSSLVDTLGREVKSGIAVEALQMDDILDEMATPQ